MKIAYCKRSSVTGRTLQKEIGYKYNGVLLNLGNSSFTEEDYYKEVINRVKAIRNCVNKKRMFEILKSYSVPSLTYFDLKKIGDIIRAEAYIIKGKALVLRNNTRFKIVSSIREFKSEYRNYTYATLKERKLKEYRIVMFKGVPIRRMIKIVDEPNFKLKQDNCHFVTIENAREDIIQACKEAVSCLEIDLCGIDICITDKDRAKIIEVNSGMSLSERSRERLKEELKKRYG